MIPKHIDIFEIDQEVNRWKNIETNLRVLCKQANIAYAFKIQPSDIGSFVQDRILLFYVFDLVYSKLLLEEFNQQCIQHNKKLVIVCDSFFNEPVELSNLIVISDPKLLSLCSGFDQLLPTVRSKSKLFNCFIHRADPTRQSWFYFLYLNGLLDQGYASFLLYQTYEIQSHLDLYDDNHNSGLNSLEKFRKAYKDLRNSVPYRNFEDNKNLNHLILDSKYSLILETYASIDDHYATYISEKTIRSLEHPCLDLIFGQPGTFKQLSDHNIVFNKKLAEVDDNSWINRQQNILKVLTKDTIDVSIEHMYEQCNHNRDLFGRWYREIASPKYYEKYIDLL